MDLSYFEEPYESLVSEATYDSEGIEISPAIYETLQRRKPTPRTKSLTDVERVIGRHKGGNDKAIDIMDEVGSMFRLEGRLNSMVKVGDVEKVVSRIKPAAELVLNSFKEMNTPDEIALEFGLNFKAKTGVVFASADSEATFKVSLKWTNKQ